MLPNTIRSAAREALPASRVSHAIDRVEATFDEPSLVANAGLVAPATLMVRLGLESLINSTLRLVGRGGAAGPQDLDVGGDDPGWRVAHRSRRRVARRSNRAGVAVSGDGPLDVGYVLAFVHLRACPPTRSGSRRGGAAGVATGRRAGRGDGDDRSGLDDLRGVRQTQARCRLQAHQGAGLPPAAGEPRRYRLTNEDEHRDWFLRCQPRLPHR